VLQLVGAKALLSYSRDTPVQFAAIERRSHTSVFSVPAVSMRLFPLPPLHAAVETRAPRQVLEFSSPDRGLLALSDGVV